jgi:BlaI family penicillinase repressor
MATKEPIDPLSPMEWKIMKIVWRLKSCAARDVYQAAGREYGWAPNTVKTFLGRLVDKGFLAYTQVGNSYLYRPARPALKSLIGAANVLLDNALEGTVGPLLAHMVKKSNLSPEELAQLRALLDHQSGEMESES